MEGLNKEIKGQSVNGSVLWSFLKQGSDVYLREDTIRSRSLFPSSAARDDVIGTESITSSAHIIRVNWKELPAAAQ